MIYKTTSSKYVIAKVLRDINPQNDNFIVDAFEWLGEALEFIGTPLQYELKSEKINIVGHKAELPCDLYLIEQVSLNGHPMKYGGQSFPFGLHCEDCISGSTSSTNRASFLWVTNPNDPLGREDGENFLPIRTNFYGGYSHEVYYIDGNYIKTSCEEDEICIFYRAFRTDCDGYPEIPDAIQFKEALYWYIRTKMIGSGFQDPIFSYADAEQRWLKYCSQARSKADIPSYDQMESLKNRWVRLIPQINSSRDFFKGLGDEERLLRNYNTNRFI